MTAIRHRIIVASVLERGGRFLCVEEMVDGLLKLSQPAGKLEVGETPIQGAVRETREESGYSFLPTHLVGIYEHYCSATQTIYLRLAYTGGVFAPEGPLTQPTDPSIHAVHWLTYEQLDRARARHRNPFVMQCVDDYLLGRWFPLDMVTSFLPARPHETG